MRTKDSVVAIVVLAVFFLFISISVIHIIGTLRERNFVVVFPSRYYDSMNNSDVCVIYRNDHAFIAQRAELELVTSH